jgi:hypothetical protein
MFPGTGPHVECRRRVGEICRDRQPGKHVNEKSHRQPRVPAANGVPRGRDGVVGTPEGRFNAVGGRSRQATDEDDGMDWRFSMGFSVNSIRRL